MQSEKPKEMVSYLGRFVQKEGFRAFIYNSDGSKKIAESFEEFEVYTSSDNWFATEEEARAPQRNRKKKD